MKHSPFLGIARENKAGIVYLAEKCLVHTAGLSSGRCLEGSLKEMPGKAG